MEIRSNNKATVQAALRQAILSQCDATVQAMFLEHYFTQEPLLMQILRELRALRGALERPGVTEA